MIDNNHDRQGLRAVTENIPHIGSSDGKFSLDLRVEYLPFSKEEKERIQRDTSPIMHPRKSWATKILPKYKAPFSRVGRGDWIVSPNSEEFYVQETPGNVDSILPDEWIAHCELTEETAPATICH